MKKSEITIERILDSAHRLFNESGIAAVTIRGIAAAAGISHGNLTYHFKDRSEILLALHERLLQRALSENRAFKDRADPLESLIETTRRGFAILMEYRFLMIDLIEAVRTAPILRDRLREVEKIRSSMYLEAIETMKKAGYLRKPTYDTEYEDLIERIRIFSDFWIASSEIYRNMNQADQILHNTRLFLTQFYPYLTKKGVKRIRENVLNFEKHFEL